MLIPIQYTEESEPRTRPYGTGTAILNAPFVAVYLYAEGNGKLTRENMAFGTNAGCRGWMRAVKVIKREMTAMCDAVEQMTVAKCTITKSKAARAKLRRWFRLWVGCTITGTVWRRQGP